MVYEPNISYNMYQWSSFLISFIEIVNIGLILSGMSKIHTLGNKTWEKNEEFIAVVELLKEPMIELKKIKIRIIGMKIKTKTFFIVRNATFLKYKILIMLLTLRTKKDSRKLTKIKKEVEKIKKEVERKVN